MLLYFMFILVLFPIFLYFDAFQINDALGSHTKSIEGIYYTIPVVPQHHLAHLNNIFLAGFINSEDVKNFGNQLTLQRLITNLKDLSENGIEINYNKENIKIFFVLGQILGDNLGLNEILGYTKSFNSNSYCRICTRTKLQCQNDFIERLENVRDKRIYSEECLNIENSSAVKEISIWNNLFEFHVTDNKACDIMHDIYLGVGKYNISKILNYFINVKKVFTLEAFNYRKQMFDYGPVLVGNISQPINQGQLRTGNIKLNASEMKTFLSIILLLIGDLIDHQDTVYQFLIIFIRIVDIILREEFDDFILATLSDLISKHHEFYINIFKDTLKPKHHFMVHYPTVIKLLGPLKHLWSFRFESKHQMSKQYCHIIASRKNVPLSLAIKHSIHFSNTLITNSFFKSDAKNFKNISKTDLSQLDFYKNLTTNFKRVFKVKSLIYRGILFEENCYVKMQKRYLKFY